jgi:hypothetical protein
MAVADIADSEELARLAAETGIDLSGLPALMTSAQLAPLLGTTVEVLANQRYKRRGIPFIRLGSKRVRYLRADVARYLLSNRQETA